MMPISRRLLAGQRRLRHPFAACASLLALTLALVAAAAAPALAQGTGLNAACAEGGATTGGGAHNVVRLDNPTGGDLSVHGSAQLNHIPGPTAAPVNCALVRNGVPGVPDVSIPPPPACVGCQSVAVALQINLISRDAQTIAPHNVAIAENLRCTGCAAVALAYQYTLQEDDPNQVPPDAQALVRALDQELQSLQTRHTLSPTVAADEIDSVVNQFNQLGATLDAQRSTTP